ncbi:MAG: polysaccharide deacetylase family protein [Brevinematales bacterium]|nr:polysaccharide deacetylase family protein [Brevinematales bacterium]
MRKNSLFLGFIALLGAVAISFSAYLYWQTSPPDLSIEGNYTNPFDTLSFEEILYRLPGSIPILQYHILMTPRNSPWLAPLVKRRPKLRRFVLTSEEFRNHLSTLYQNGFRPISLDEYLALENGSLSSLKRLAPNTKPFVLTFDDATYGQFDFVDTNGDGTVEIDPECAIGILIDFHRNHPDFALTGAFCIDFSKVPFLQPSYVEQKLNLLLDYGFEIVNHTKNHTSLSRLFKKSPHALAQEIGEAMEKFESYLGYRAKSINKIAYPNGHISPEVKEAIREISYNNKTYHFVAALHAYGLQAPRPASSRFDPYAIPRIEMSDKNLEKFVLLAPHLMKMPSLTEKNTKD